MATNADEWVDVPAGGDDGWEDVPVEQPKPPERKMSGGGALAVSGLNSSAVGLLPRASAFNDAIQKVGGRQPGTDLSIDITHPSSIAKNILQRNEYSGNYLSKLLSHPIDTVKETADVYSQQLPGYQGGLEKADRDHPYLSLAGKVLPMVANAPKSVGQMAITGAINTLGGTDRDYGKVVTSPKEAAKLAGETGVNSALAAIGMKYPVASGVVLAAGPAMVGDQLGMSEAQKQQTTASGLASLLAGGGAKFLKGRGEGLVKRGASATEEALVGPRQAVEKTQVLQDKAATRAGRANDLVETAKLRAEQLPTPEGAAESAKAKLQAIFDKRRGVRELAEQTQVEDFAKRAMDARQKATAEQNTRARSEYDTGEKTLGDQRKNFDSEVTDLGKRRLEGRQQSDQGLVDAYQSQERAKAQVSKAVADAQSDQSSPAARALSKLGHESKDVYAAARLLQGMGEKLDPELQGAVDILLPDYKATAATKAQEFSGGKAAYLEKLTKQFEAQDAASKGSTGQPTPPNPDTRIYDMEGALQDAVPPKTDPVSLVGDNTRRVLAQKVGYPMARDNPDGAASRMARIFEKYGLDTTKQTPEGIFSRKSLATPEISNEVGTRAERLSAPKRAPLTEQPVTIPFPSEDVAQPPKFSRRADTARMLEAKAKARMEDPNAVKPYMDKAAFRRTLAEKQITRTQKTQEAAGKMQQEAKDALVKAQSAATPEAVRAQGKTQVKDAAIHQGLFGGIESLAKGGPFGAVARKAYSSPEARAYLFDTVGKSLQNQPHLVNLSRVVAAKDLTGLLNMAKGNPKIAAALDRVFGGNGE